MSNINTALRIQTLLFSVTCDFTWLFKGKGLPLVTLQAHCRPTIALLQYLNALSTCYPLSILYVSCIYRLMFVCIVYICHMCASMLVLIRVWIHLLCFWFSPPLFLLPSPLPTHSGLQTSSGGGAKMLAHLTTTRKKKKVLKKNKPMWNIPHIY